jgi:hypothetical protein
VTFDLTFTPFSGVFGGACEKYIPLSVMEGMEIHLQLENVQNCIQYQFFPPESSGDTIGTDQWSTTALVYATTPLKSNGAGHIGDAAAHNQYYLSHKFRSNEATSNTEADKIAGGDNSVVWSQWNAAQGTDNTGEAEDDGVYRWNLYLIMQGI